jgi:hypothetical protein
MRFEPPIRLKRTDDLWDLGRQAEPRARRVALHDYLPEVKAIFIPELLCPITGEVAARAFGPSPNTILDRALEKFLDGFRPKDFNVIGVGTGAAVPNRVQDGLLDEKARADGGAPHGPRMNAITQIDSTSWSLEAYFPAAYANYDLTEAGLWNGVAGYMNRSLFLDLSENPVIVPKTSAFLLRVTSQVVVVLNP